MKLKAVLPKGKMFPGIIGLLKEAGIKINQNGKNLRLEINDNDLEVKLLKPQNIGKLVELGRHDIGITGYDWLMETGSKTTELLNLNLYNGQVVAAISKESKKTLDDFFKEPATVASEFEQISKDYLDSEGFNYLFIRSYGATEAFPPEDADIIIDNCFSGKTLQENNLKIINVLLNTSARLIANKQSLEDEEKRKKIYEITAKLKKVVESGFNENNLQ